MLLYVYGCGGREDGLNFAVSLVGDEPGSTTLALFRTPGDAASFAKEKAERLGWKLSYLPSFHSDALRFGGVPVVREGGE